MPEFRQPRNRYRNFAGEAVPAEIKKLEARQAVDIIGNRPGEVILREVKVIKVRTIVKSGGKATYDEIELKIKVGEIVEIAKERGEGSVQIVVREKQSSDRVVGALNLRPCTMRSIRGEPMADWGLVLPKLVQSE